MSRGVVVARGVAVIAIIVGAAAILARIAAGFGELPECGTGSYFLYPLEPLGGLVIYGFFVTAAALGLLMVLGLRPVGCVVGLLLVTIEAVAAAGAALWSDAAHGCAQFRSHGYEQESAWIVGIAGLAGVALAVGLGSLFAWLGRSTHDQPAWTSHVVRAGVFRVGGVGREPRLAGLVTGDLVWVGASPHALLLERTGPDVGRAGWDLDRDGLVADVLGRTTGVWRAGVELLELEPEPGTDPLAVVTALERSAGRPRSVSPAAPPG